MLSDLSVQQVIAICGSLAGIIVALVRYRSIKHDNKIDAFKINHELISKSRFIYSEEALKAYYEYEKKCFVKSSKKSLYLISKDSWIGVMDLDKIVVTNNSEKYHKNSLFNIMKIALLPDIGKTYSQNLRKYVGAPIFNANVIAMRDDTPTQNGIQINAYEIRYFDYLDHIGMREMYLAKLMEDGFKNNNNRIKSRLKRMFENLPMLDLTNRPAVIGACALCFFTNVKESEYDVQDGESYLLIHKRNGKVAEARNTVSMVPAGSLTWDDDPTVHENDNNMAFFSTIIREFEEEVLGCSEVEWTDKYTKPPILTDNNIFQYKSLGLGLDPLSTKVEQMSLIIVNGGKACNKLKSYIATKRIIKFDNCDFLTLNDLNNIINNNSSEGTIHIIQVNYENLLRLMLSKESMPVFREAIHQILKSDNEELRTMIKIRDYDENHFTEVENEIYKDIRSEKATDTVI